LAAAVHVVAAPAAAASKLPTEAFFSVTHSAQCRAPILADRSPARERVLLIAPHSSYRTIPFIEAARKLGVDALVASEGQHSVISAYLDGLHINLLDPDGAVALILQAAQAQPFAAIIGTDDITTELAAVAAQRLGLSHNSPAAVHFARRKDLARQQLAQQGVAVPRHRCIDLRAPLAAQAEQLKFPCVLKPLTLSASRGVMRVDNVEQFFRACARIERLLQSEGVKERDIILAEDFIAGVEVAIEGVLCRGVLEVLAIFDKPDPLDGPYFEETYYVTPSRLSRATQSLLQEQIQASCNAYGLHEGPIHAECRINPQGIWVLEVAARTIGGLCGRLFRTAAGCGLEELVLAHALGRRSVGEQRNDAAGVLMIPVPQAGILRRVEGVMAAQRIPYIDEVVIQLREGHELVPWPEGSSYLGFIFAHAPTPEQAEAALREAHDRLTIVVAPLWKLSRQETPVAAQTSALQGR
jgi:biotin carboxylase